MNRKRMRERKTEGKGESESGRGLDLWFLIIFLGGFFTVSVRFKSNFYDRKTFRK